MATASIGPLTTVIEAQGSTSLVQVANNYFLYPVGGSSGPELSFLGAPFVAGQIGRVDADRRGEDGERLRGCLAGTGDRSIHRLEHRQQRPLPLGHRRRVWKQPGAGMVLGVIIRRPR